MHDHQRRGHVGNPVTSIPNGGDSVVSALAACGVDTVFGIPASYTIEIYDALARDGRFRSIVARNEQAAAFMADGYARRTGKPGVVVVTGGPGLGNTVTGLQTAYADSSPLVVIASDLEPAQRSEQPLGLPHEAVDQAGLAAATGAIVARADDPGSIRTSVCGTIAQSLSGRNRPGVVLISRSAMEAPASDEPDVTELPEATPSTATYKELSEAVDLLRTAVDPLVLVGAGVAGARAEDELESFLALSGFPYVTTVPGSSSANRSGNWLGVLDNPTSRKRLSSADVVLALGTSFGAATTKSWTLKISGSLIHVDIDPRSLGQHYQPRLAIEEDARSFLVSLISLFAESAPPDPQISTEANQPLLTHRWIAPIESALPKVDATICVDVTMASGWIPGGISLGPTRKLMMPWNFMTLGWAYAAALGTQAAVPDDTVLAVMGDGGALFTIGELATAVDHQLPVVLLVFNNRSYGIIADLQDKVCDGRRFGVDLGYVDFCSIANAFGLSWHRAKTPEELETALKKSFTAREPTVIEALVEISDLGTEST